MPESDDTLNLDDALKQGDQETEKSTASGETTEKAGIETPQGKQPEGEVTPSTTTPPVEPQAEIETAKAISDAAKAAVKKALELLTPHKDELTAQMTALGKLVGYPATSEGYPKVAAVKGLEEILKDTSLSAEDQDHLVSLVKAEDVRKQQIIIAERTRLNDALEKAQRERVAIQKELIAEQTIRKHVEETKHVETELKHLPGKADETATLLMKARVGMGEDYAKLETLLKSADAIIQKGSFLKNLGSEIAIEGSPEAELESEVKKAMEADPDAKEAVVRANILKTNSELYRRLSPPVKQE